MSGPAERPSARRDELLGRAYGYALEHGLADLSLRPLAAAIGSSPRVLLFLFGSKEGLLRALLARARAEELAMLPPHAPAGHPGGSEHGGPEDGGTDGDGDGLAGAVRAVWAWLADPAHRPLLRLWVQAYARSLTEPDGPWAGFARATVDDWLGLLRTRGGPPPSPAETSLALAVLRGALLDLLATDDLPRTTAAVDLFLDRRTPR